MRLSVWTSFVGRAAALALPGSGWQDSSLIKKGIDCMLLETALELGILLLLAILTGAMVFFSLVMAPLIFIKLDAPVASRFIRAVFPWYYLCIILLSGAASALLAQLELPLALLMALITLTALYNRFLLLRRINRLRDAAKKGDKVADAQFKQSHRLSVWINAAQMLTVIVVLSMYYL